MSEMESYTDVVELCALMQCLGFSIKTLDTNDGNVSQDAGARTVVINCQTSGLNVVMECAGACTCPVPSEQNSGFWQVSGVSGGKLIDTETGSGLLGSLPKAYRERLTKELSDMVRCIKEVNESVDRPREMNNSVERRREANKSASMIEMNTPEKGYLLQLKADTPTRYRSLDTLTSVKDEEPLPLPGALEKAPAKTADVGNTQKNIMCRRQSTYTISSTPGSIRYRRNKTSSPIHGAQNTVLETLVAAENTAEELKKKLAFAIRELMDEERNDSSVSSLALDVSKISVLKGAETSKAQFASSPNLSGLGTLHEELTKSRLKRFESASTSNLSPITTSDKKISKLRRISPSIFKMKKDGPSVKSQDGKSKLQSLFKSKIVTPVRTPSTTTEPSPSLSARKKFSHVKSTIPRPTSKKE